jgi:TPR repeat protein
LGQIYHHAKGVVKNLTEAAGWYRKAANLGYRDAQFALGCSSKDGGVVDQHEAMIWLLKLVESGDRAAQWILGERYYWANGVQHDINQALAWYLKAAEQGNSNAIYKLARLYAEGNEVPRDLALAALWYRKAVDSGCDHDYGEAERWLEKHTETGEGA